jgi:hypothetical protein
MYSAIETPSIVTNTRDSMKMSIRFNWLRQKSNNGSLWTQNSTLAVQWKRGHSWTTEQVTICQEYLPLFIPCFLLGSLFDHEDGDHIFLRNVCGHLSNYTALQSAVSLLLIFSNVLNQRSSQVVSVRVQRSLVRFLAPRASLYRMTIFKARLEANGRILPSNRTVAFSPKFIIHHHPSTLYILL